MPHPTPVPDDRKTERWTALYIGLTSLRAREIVSILGREDYVQQRGAESAWLQELALILDDRLVALLERRKGCSEE